MAVVDVILPLQIPRVHLGAYFGACYLHFIKSLSSPTGGDPVFGRLHNHQMPRIMRADTASSNGTVNDLKSKSRLEKGFQQPNSQARRPVSRLDMLREIEEIDLWETVSISALAWLLLAGYLVFPSTFASIQKSDVLNKAGEIGRSVDHVVRNVPLIYFASFLCLLSSAGLAWFWWQRRHNYVWVLRRISL